MRRARRPPAAAAALVLGPLAGTGLRGHVSPVELYPVYQSVLPPSALCLSASRRALQTRACAVEATGVRSAHNTQLHVICGEQVDGKGRNGAFPLGNVLERLNITVKE